MEQKKKKALYLVFAVVLVVFCVCAMIYLIWTHDTERIFPMALCAAGSIIISIRFFIDLKNTGK